MKAVVQDEIGAPLDVLQLRDVPLPVAGPGEVLVRMVAASINPGDFLFVQKLYPAPKHPALPGQITGNHGMGRVEALGPGVTGFRPGQAVAFSHMNTWAEFAAVPQAFLVPLPDPYPPALGAQLLNLVTARDLLDQVRVPSGGWLAVTAAYSTVGSMVAQMARARGVRTLALVRRERPGTAVPGATQLLSTQGLDTPLPETVHRLTGGQGLAGVIDSVGGPLLADLVRSLNLGGRAVIYGGFSALPFELHNFDLLMRGAALETYVYRYFFDPPQPEDAAGLRQLIDLSLSPDFVAPAAGWHTLDDFKEAVRLSLDQPEVGKRFFHMPGAHAAA